MSVMLYGIENIVTKLSYKLGIQMYWAYLKYFIALTQ